MLARKLHRPTGRQVVVHGPTGGHAHAPRGMHSDRLLELLGTRDRHAAYTVPGGRIRKVFA